MSGLPVLFKIKGIMGISERREREKAERRRAILNCARELILSEGVERVSMEDIARKAELSKATVYLYFSGKEVILNEICEEAARVFLERFKPYSETGVTGLKAMKCFWRGYVELFGHSDEMLIIFQVRNYLNSWPPVVFPDGQSESPRVDTILEVMKTVIEQCKAEGVFDPDLDSDLATRLLLSMFSSIVEKVSRMPPEPSAEAGRDTGKSPAIIEEMSNAFRIILRGFAREGIDRSCLDITVT
jgi:AcrR family transcriptional regulator